jgi:hypothetical protein
MTHVFPWSYAHVQTCFHNTLMGAKLVSCKVPNALSLAHLPALLSSRHDSIKQTSISPRAYANTGESKPFCPSIIHIGVLPKSLLYKDAIAATGNIREILTVAGFPEIEVAFVKSLVTCYTTSYNKLLYLDPLNDIPKLQRPFTPMLSLAIALKKTPQI